MPPSFLAGQNVLFQPPSNFCPGNQGRLMNTSINMLKNLYLPKESPLIVPLRWENGEKGIVDNGFPSMAKSVNAVTERNALFGID